MNKKIIFSMLIFLYVFSLFKNTSGYTVIVTSNTQTKVIEKDWQVTNSSDSPILPEHKYTWNSQKNHLYNPSNLNPAYLWLNSSNYFYDSELNETIQVRDFQYQSDISYNWDKYNKIMYSDFIYQLYTDYTPNAIELYFNNTQIFMFESEYRPTSVKFSINSVYQSNSYVFGLIGDTKFTGIHNEYPNLLLTLTIGIDNSYEVKIKALNASIWQAFDYYPYTESEINQVLLTGYLDTSFLNETLTEDLSLKISTSMHRVLGASTPNRVVVYAENSNWWLPDTNTTFIAYGGELQEQKSLNVLGFNENDITTFIKCRYVNYQKPTSWESRFSQNLTVTQYTDTKYFSEFPQIAYQSSFFPILDTYDVFSVTTNYYIAAWGIVFNGQIYNRSLFQVFSTDNEFLVSAAWETTGNLNLTLVVLGSETSFILPATDVTLNDFMETGIFIINNTYFGVLLSQKLIMFNVTTGISNNPRELQVYGCLFRGSEIRDNINVTSLVSEITDYFHPDGTLMPIFASNFFLSKYRSVSMSLTYSFEIASPNQDESRFRKNYTFSPFDIYFREGKTKAYFESTSSRYTLSILYLMKIMQQETEYSRAQLYNRTVYHTDLAGKRSLQSVRIDIELQYIMLTLDYIVPLTLYFDVELNYYIYVTNKAPSLVEFFLSTPALSLFTPMILIVVFPVVFYESSGKRKIFAGIGLFVGIIINAVLGLLDPILSVLFAIISAIIVYFLIKRRDDDF